MIRAAREQITAKKTWFVTLTFGPKRRAAILMAASAMSEKLSQSERLARAAGWYVQTFTKRLRKSGFEVRYLWVPEPHLDGFPHFHGLVHDQRGDLTWEALNSAWSAGFSVLKLVRDGGAIRYVTKYIAKARYGRLRSSQSYGTEPANAESVVQEHEVRASIFGNAKAINEGDAKKMSSKTKVKGRKN